MALAPPASLLLIFLVVVIANLLLARKTGSRNARACTISHRFPQERT
jgi:hypothetical protein